MSASHPAETQTSKPAADEGAGASLSRRTRLRNRILLFTIAWGALLIAATSLLAWKSRQSQRELEVIVHRDLSGVSELEQLIRNQTSWEVVWNDAISGDAALSEAALRYGAVRQTLDSPALRALELGTLPNQVRELESVIVEAASSWRESSGPRRLQLRTEIRNRSTAVRATAYESAKALRREADRRLREIARGADSVLLVALGTSWMIAVVGLAVARMALVKIVKPIEHLSRAATAVAAHPSGAARVPITGDREIAILAHDFNLMIDAIAARDAELAELAATDELTGLPNFRSFQEDVMHEIQRSERTGHSFGLLIFDLDHFKSYNDRYGHLAGNEALVVVARAIREQLRNIDSPSRYGGEEFAAIVTEVEAKGLAQTAERIRAAIEAIPPIEDRQGLTCSIGGAMYPQDGNSADSLFAAADRRLYQAKAAGRNRVVAN